jgi:hypothetical protein
MVIKSVLSWVDILCRSLASQGCALQIHAGTRGKKALFSVAWLEQPNECSRTYGKFTILYHTKVFSYVFGLTASSVGSILPPCWND